MLKIIVNGKEYKSKYSPLKDKICMLNYNFVLSGKIDKNQWAKDYTKIKDFFNLDIREYFIDGRGKESKKLKYFSWLNVL